MINFYKTKEKEKQNGIQKTVIGYGKIHGGDWRKIKKLRYL